MFIVTEYAALKGEKIILVNSSPCHSILWHSIPPSKTVGRSQKAHFRSKWNKIMDVQWTDKMIVYLIIEPVHEISNNVAF